MSARPCSTCLDNGPGSTQGRVEIMMTSPRQLWTAGVRFATHLLGAGLLFSAASPARAQEATAERAVPMPAALQPSGMAHQGGEVQSESRISDEVLGILPVPDRPRLVVEKNGLFLGPGFLSPGYELCTGAVWRPSLWVFGTNRFTVQHFEDHEGTNVDEVVNRLDLFSQLNLTGTERLLFG